MDSTKKKLDNKIVQSNLEKFLDDYGIIAKDLSTSFEHFCNYCAFSLKYPELYHNDFNFSQLVHTGNGGDCAIDGILILVNGIPVTTLEETKGEIERKGAFTVDYIFVQAKTSPEFDSGEILKVGQGVHDFFKERNLPKANDKILKYKKISDCIFEKAASFSRKPTCSIFYVTTGKWTNDTNLQRSIDNQIRLLDGLNYFYTVEYYPVDADRLINIYKEINNSIKREVIIAKNVAFPRIEGAEDVYLGLIPKGEFIKLITDESGVLLQGVFYENVRAYLGDNPVNTEITRTLKDKNVYVQFPLLNNGITIVSKKLEVVGERFFLTDYQIVNGCQTSNVLYRCKDDVDNGMLIPVKIIHTESSDLVNRVIRSTNRQTQVLDEAFESLEEFHKQLQDYYNTYKGQDRLYYERRSHEYDDQRNIKQHNIITLPIQMLSYLSMFIGEPHSVHRYYGELLKNNRSKLFAPNHKLIAYYTAAQALHRVDMALNNEGISHLKWRYHIIFSIQTISRLLIGMNSIPYPNSKDMETLCKKILIILGDDTKFRAVYHQAIDIILDTNSHTTVSDGRNGPERTKEFTNALLDNIKIKVESIKKNHSI